MSGNGFPPGFFMLRGVPANEFAALTFQKDGFLPSLRVIETQTSEITLPVSENTMFRAGTFMGTTADPSKGQIAFFVTSPGAQPPPSVSVTLSEWTMGEFSASSGPTYLGPDGSPILDATAGTSGGFVNLLQGMYVLQFGHADAACTALSLYGQPMTTVQKLPSGEASVLVPVLAGYVTTPVTVSCVSTP